MNLPFLLASRPFPAEWEPFLKVIIFIIFSLPFLAVFGLASLIVWYVFPGPPKKE